MTTGERLTLVKPDDLAAAVYLAAGVKIEVATIYQWRRRGDVPVACRPYVLPVLERMTEVRDADR